MYVYIVKWRDSGQHTNVYIMYASYKNMIQIVIVIAVYKWTNWRFWN